MHADCAATPKQPQAIEHFCRARRCKFGTSLECPVEIFGRNRTLIFSTNDIAKWTARTLQRYSIPSLFRFDFFFRVLTFPIPGSVPSVHSLFFQVYVANSIRWIFAPTRVMGLCPVPGSFDPAPSFLCTSSDWFSPYLLHWFPDTDSFSINPFHFLTSDWFLFTGYLPGSTGYPGLPWILGGVGRARPLCLDGSPPWASPRVVGPSDCGCSVGRFPLTDS